MKYEWTLLKAGKLTSQAAAASRYLLGYNTVIVTRLVHGSSRPTGRFLAGNFTKLIFRQLKSLSTYRDPSLSLLTHHSSVQFATFNFAIFCWSILLSFAIWRKFILSFENSTFWVIMTWSGRKSGGLGWIGSGQETWTRGQLWSFCYGTSCYVKTFGNRLKVSRKRLLN